MPKQNVSFYTFNRGLLSRLGLARIDLKRSALSAEVQNNYMPRVLGSMMLRPGWKYLLPTRNNLAAQYIPFIYASNDTALIEVTNQKIRVVVDDEVVSRAAVTAAITNGDFDTDLAGWTDADEVGATSQWATGGYMQLTGNGSAYAVRYQQVTCNQPGTEHALDIVIQTGPVILNVGSTAGGDDYINAASLLTGNHSLTFTPAGDFYVQFSSPLNQSVYVDSVQIGPAGAMEIDAPWLEADLDNLRWDQSGDVVFVACNGYQQRRIERRSQTAWSVVLYQTSNGPFRTENTSPTTITPSGLVGDITLTASDPLFRTGQVGALFSLTSSGQRVEASFTADNQFSDPIRVTGVGDARKFTITRSGTWTATITLQRSIDDVGSWEDVTSYTTNASVVYDDGLDNQIVYYRLGIKTGNYTSGTANVSLVYSYGSLTGYVRITAYTSQTVVSAEVLKALGGVTATDVWAEGAWSDYRGWPTAVCLYEGRLWWAGKDKIFGSVSDAYDDFDATTEGDSGPINRNLATGPVDVVNYLLPVQRLLIGTLGSEISARSTSFDEPLTPTNINLKDSSTQGSAAVAAVKMDKAGFFVQRSKTKLFMLDLDATAYNYASSDMTQLVPEIGQPEIVHLAIQRQPDTRIHCIRSDGTVAVLIFDQLENVTCWVTLDTDGTIEDIAVLPGTEEDQVYYVVARTVGGNTVRYLEKWALESECVGGTINPQADSYAIYSGASTRTITGFSHLAGRDVVVWGDGSCFENNDGSVATFTVSGSGTIELPSKVSNAIAGLPYTAQWKSTKLAYAAGMGTPLNQSKRVDQIGFVLANTHNRGIVYGSDFETMYDMPREEAYAIIDPNKIWEHFDFQTTPFGGGWSTDSRICLQSQAPRPANLLACTIAITTNDKV